MVSITKLQLLFCNKYISLFLICLFFIPLLYSISLGNNIDLNQGKAYSGSISQLISDKYCKYLISEANGEVKLWSTDSCTLIKTIHLKPPIKIYVSSNDKYLIAVGENFQSIYQIPNFNQCYKSEMKDLSILPIGNDNRYLIYSSPNYSITVCSLSTGSYLRTINYASNLAAHGSGMLGSADKSIYKSWDNSFAITTGYSKVLWGPTGIGVTQDPIIEIWSLNDAKLLKKIKTQKNYLKEITFTSDSKYLINNKDIYSLPKFKKIGELEEFNKHIYHEYNPYNCISAISNSNKYYAEVVINDTILIWEIPTGKLRSKIATHNWFNASNIDNIKFVQDSLFLIAQNKDFAITYWSIKENNLKWFISINKSSSYRASDPQQILIAPDQSCFIITGWSISGIFNSSYKVISCSNGKLIDSINTTNCYSPLPIISNDSKNIFAADTLGHLFKINIKDKLEYISDFIDPQIINK